MFRDLFYGNGASLEEGHLFHYAEMIHLILTAVNTIVYAIVLFTCRCDKIGTCVLKDRLSTQSSLEVKT